MTVTLRYSARSDIGLVRQTNQDSGYAGPHLCAMCDGMGGPAGGDIASAIAIEHLAPLDADSHQASEMLGLLREAIQSTHTDLVTLSNQDPDLAGLGTTCVAVMRSGNKLAMVHVGDSRAYLLRDGGLTQVTTDHTFVEYLVESGRLTREQARRHPQRSVLLRVLGDAEGEVQLDESIREAVPGDRWLLCSDGLSGPVTAETIAEVLSTVPDPGQAGDQLIDLALRAGGPDNVTVVIFDVVEEAEADTTPQLVGAVANRRARLAAAAGDSPESRPSPDVPTEILPTSPGPTAATPAAKAAALVAGLEETSGPPRTGEEEAVAAEAVAQGNSRRRRRRRSILATLVLVLALVVAGFLGYQWTQSQYYVTIADGKVAIFQGIPQALGPLELSHLVESYSEPDTTTLDDQMIRRLNETVSQPSLEAAREYINVTVMQHRTVVVLPQATATPAPSATPAPAQPAPTAPTAQPEPGAQTTAEAA